MTPNPVHIAKGPRTWVASVHVMAWLTGINDNTTEGFVAIPPRVFDIDDVEDIVVRIDQMLASSNFTVQSTEFTIDGPLFPSSRPPVPNDRATLERLVDSDRSRLILQVTALREQASADEQRTYESASVRVSFSRRIGAGYFVICMGGQSSNDEQRAFEPEVAKILEDYGSRRILWYRLKPLLPVPPVVVLLIAWVILETTTKLPLAAHIVGWTGAAYTIAASLATSLYLASRDRTRVTGNLIIGQTRSATRAARANTKRDVKVAVYSVAGTLLVLAIGVILTLAGIKH